MRVRFRAAFVSVANLSRRWDCNSPLTTMCDIAFLKFSAAVNLTPVKPVMSRVAFSLVLLVITLGTMSGAQTVTLVLQEEVSSKLPTGTTFTAMDSAGKIYHGHVVTHPARRFLRRGSMILVFDEPVLPVTKDSEGVFRAGNKMRLLKLGGSLAAAKLADDAVDGAIGAAKARYLGLAAGAALMVFQKGGEAKLHKGDTMEVEPRRTRTAQITDTP